MRLSQPSAAVVAWGNAWLTGNVGLDEAVDAVTGPQVISPNDEPLRVFLAGLRSQGLTELRLALPVPGDPLGLTGPADFNAAALEAGEAVLTDIGLGLIPEPDVRGSSYLGVRWTVHAAVIARPDVPSLPEADQQLTVAMREVTEVMSGLDDVNGERSRFLKALRDDADSSLAPGYPARAHRVAALANRLSLVVELARDAAGHNLTAAQMRQRSEALQTLDRAVRRARVAAHSAVFVFDHGA
ncbi:MAG: hypothetical protein ABIS86_18850 [Streptosporangiaceae bacterium]